MAETQETVNDIVAEKRRQADEIERDVAEKMKRGEMISDCYARELVADIRREADRIDAAHRRERGDAAKLREALKAIVGLCAGLMPTWDGAVGRIKDIADAALSAPPRNCDVYTSDELKVKFKSELASELPIANEHEKNLVTITAMGVIDTLFATTQKGGNDAD